MKIRPIGERVLIKQIKEAEKTESGIFIPEDAKEEKKQGIIEEVGDLKNDGGVSLKKGDKVIYGGYSSEEIDINEEKYLLINFKDILARIE